MVRIDLAARGQEGVAHAVAVLLIAALAIVGVVALAQQLDTPVVTDGKTAAVLGIEVRNADPGAYVTGVTANGPADDAGIGSGDIVVAVDNVNITTTTDLTRALHDKHPDESVRVGWIDRQRQFRTQPLQLAAGPPG